jgi:hypothetical protein
MTDNKQPAITANEDQPGSSLIGMLVAGLVLIVIGMFAVVFIA